MSNVQGHVPAVLDNALAATHHQAGAASSAAPSRQQARLEIRYMEFSIDHHAMGVQMSQLCVQKAVNADLKDLCGRIAQDQSNEIAQLRGYLKAWYGIDHQPQMTRGDQQQLDRLARLSGHEFDIAVSEMFIRHHEQIIRGSERVEDRLYHPELRQFAQHVITEQSQDIAEFQAILKSYGVHYHQHDSVNSAAPEDDWSD